MFRRTALIVAVATALMGGGAFALLDSLLPGSQVRMSQRESLALAAFGTASVILTLGMFSLRRGVHRAGEMIRHWSPEDEIGIKVAHPDLEDVTKALDSWLERAGRVSLGALNHVKELEIRLKVADAERQHAQAIIYSISDAVLVTDSYDELILANDSAAKTFQFELPGKNHVPIDSVLKDTAVVTLIREMRQSRSRQGRRIVEHMVHGPEGDRTFKVTLSSLPGGTDESAAGVVAVLHDMTREKEVAKLKSDFVSNVSHELRTPLASIKAYVEMLIDGEATEEKTRGEFYEVIHTEANRLGRLIDNILNISRIESGLVKVNKQQLSLMVLAKESVEVIRPQAMQKSITIDEQISPATHQTLGDRDMINEVFLNLLSNAVKYTPQGGRVTVRTDVDEDRRVVWARIIDTGVGIPAKELPFVFDKFYRVESNNRMAKGTGLGLSLVKHMIETVHEGRVFVESEPGKGSTFGFELPLAD